MTMTHFSLAMMIASLLSLIGDLYIVVTFWMFENARNKIYIKLVFCIAASDLLAALGTVVGQQETGSPLCVFQSITSTACHMLALHWTLVLTRILYKIVMKGQTTKIKLLSPKNALIISSAFLLSLLPLITNKLGPIDSDLMGRCFVANNHADNGVPSNYAFGSLFWIIVSYYLWVLISFCWIAFSFVTMSIRIRGLFGNERTRALKALVCRQVDKCWPYPFLVLACWLLPAIVDIAAASGAAHVFEAKTMQPLVYLAGILPILHGFFNAAAFYVFNRKMLRSEWRKAFSFAGWMWNGRKIAVTDAYAIVVDLFLPKRERVPEEEAHSMSDIVFSGIEFQPNNFNNHFNNPSNANNQSHSTLFAHYNGNHRGGGQPLDHAVAMHSGEVVHNKTTLLERFHSALSHSHTQSNTAERATNYSSNHHPIPLNNFHSASFSNFNLNGVHHNSNNNIGVNRVPTISMASNPSRCPRNISRRSLFNTTNSNNNINNSVGHSEFRSEFYGNNPSEGGGIAGAHSNDQTL